MTGLGNQPGDVSPEPGFTNQKMVIPEWTALYGFLLEIPENKILGYEN